MGARSRGRPLGSKAGAPGRSTSRPLCTLHAPALNPTRPAFRAPAFHPPVVCKAQRSVRHPRHATRRQRSRQHVKQACQLLHRKRGRGRQGRGRRVGCCFCRARATVGCRSGSWQQPAAPGSCSSGSSGQEQQPAPSSQQQQQHPPPPPPPPATSPRQQPAAAAAATENSTDSKEGRRRQHDTGGGRAWS